MERKEEVSWTTCMYSKFSIISKLSVKEDKGEGRKENESES